MLYVNYISIKLEEKKWYCSFERDEYFRKVAVNLLSYIGTFQNLALKLSPVVNLILMLKKNKKLAPSPKIKEIKFSFVEKREKMENMYVIIYLKIDAFL